MVQKLKRLLNGLILFIIFILPLLSSNRFYGFEEIKVLFFLISTTIAAFLWFLTKPEIRWDKIKITQIAFLSVLLLTSLTGSNPVNSLLGIPPYFQGWIVYVYLFLFSIIISEIDIEFINYAKVLTATSFIVAFLANYQWILKNIFNIYVPTYAGRVVSTFGQPNFYAGFLILVMGMNYFLLKETRNRILSLVYSASLLVSILAVLASGSRTAVILMIFIGLLWLIAKLSRFRIVFGASFLVILALAIFISKQASTGIFNKEMFNLSLKDKPDLTKQSVEKRPYIWITSMNVFLQSPLTGFGLENIGKGYADYFLQNKHMIFEENLNISPVLISLKDLYIDRTHNYILDILLFSGIAGVVAWIIMIILSFAKILTRKVNSTNNVLIVELVVYLIWIQFQNQSIVHLFIFWFLLGLTSAKNRVLTADLNNETINR